MLLCSGPLPLSMNQPPVDTIVSVLALGLGALAADCTLLGEEVVVSGLPCRYRDIKELFMWLVGYRGQKEHKKESQHSLWYS